MLPADIHVLEIAGEVADGAPVDWARAEAGASAAERRVVEQLRRLALVGEAARTRMDYWGPLQIRRELGAGTFGRVYLAWDPRLEREVALKLLTGDAASRLPESSAITEGRLLAQIRHPNVVTVHGADCFGGRVGIWMEFVRGRTLADIVRAEGPFSAHEAAVIGRDLCRALAAVHAGGVIHRDVKAQNVMREAGGRIVLMDFGTSSETISVSSPGLAGSPAYLAPELFAGQAPSIASDLYSLGVLLYFLASGSFPVTAASFDELKARHAAEQVTPLRDRRPDLPDRFVQAVERLCSSDAHRRPTSAGAAERLLEHILADDREIADAGPSKKRGRRIGVWLGAAALISAGALAVVLRPAASPATTFDTRNSVAIVPFRNLTADGADDDYLSEGITEDLVAHLSSLRDLRVIAGASMRRLSMQSKTEQEIGRELNVATVLTGSVRQSGTRLRIVSELVDARTGAQIWSESFDREVRDVFTLQSEVARKIAVALKGELSAPDVAGLEASRGRDFDATALYLKGRHNYALRTEDSLNRAVQFFQDAISRDATAPLPYAGLADAYTALGAYGMLPRIDAYARALNYAEKAVALEPNLAESNASLGYARKNQFDWTGAESSFRRAIAISPNYAIAHHWYSILLTQQGRFPEAITEVKAALTLDPLSLGANLHLASLLMMARRYDESVAQYQRALQMDAGFSTTYRQIGSAYGFAGNFTAAFDAYRKATEHAPLAPEDQELQADRAVMLARSGDRRGALAIARALERRYEQAGETVGGYVAAVYASLGDRDQAFSWLARARADRDPELGYLKVHPRWDPLRIDARFKTLLEQLGF